MKFTETVRQEKEPFIQLLLLGLYVVVGMFVGAISGILIALMVYGLDLVRDFSWVSGQDLQRIGALKIILVTQSIGMFFLPAWALSLTEGIKVSRFYGAGVPKPNLMLLVLLLMICSLPILGLSAEINQEMHFPAFLKSVEGWMKLKEDEAQAVTMAILKTSSIAGMVVNLFVIGLAPAICEEFAFRGALQRTVLRMVSNPHIAIWISAIAFSAIHLQFFGFFPRLFLGAAFGYIYFWTGNIWYTVFAHFLNNGYAVVVAWYMQKNNLPIEKAGEVNIAWYGYIISAILTLALFKVLKDRTKTNV